MKRAISLLLSLVMIVSVMVVTPINVGATNTQNDDYSSKIDKDITMTGNNSLGTMLASEFEEDVADQEGESECGIYGIEMDGNIAYVDIQTFIDATLIVGVFDENTDEMYCSGMVNVGKDDTIVAVKIETDALPQYYMVKAFLVDRESKTPLCKQYECDTYTQVMQEFLAKTVDDFEEEDVLNLDESDDNNFLVYGEDTIVVDNTDESKNVVQTADEENREYVIENIDDTIASLKEGDIFTYEYGEEGLLIIKVSSITIDGTTATIYGDEITLEEAFDYIKIDTADYSSEMNVDNSNLDEDVEFLGVEEPEVAQTGAKLFDDKLAAAGGLKYKIKEKKFGEDSSVSGNLVFKIGVEVVVYYDAKLFKKDEVKLGVKVDYELGVDIELKLKGRFAEVELGKMDFAPIPCIFVGFVPKFVVEGEISAELKGVLAGYVDEGVKNGEYYKDTKGPVFDAEFKVEANVFIGLAFGPEIILFTDVISVSMEFKVGIQVKAELKYTTDDHEPLGERHLCKSCIDGELSSIVELKFKFTIMDKDDFTFTATPFRHTCKAFDFYYSIDNDTFAFTSCPYKTYKQTIKVLNANGTPVADGTVNGEHCDNKGEVVLYLAKGNHTLIVDRDGIKRNYGVTVTKSDEHTFTLFPITISSTNSNNITTVFGGNISTSGKCGDNVYYKIYGTTLEIYGKGPMYDNCDGLWENYKNSITKVIIKKGVTSIGDWAFDFCTNLASIKIPDSVTSIGNCTFSDCYSLTSIKIPESVTSIGDNAFFYCNSLTSITIPNSVTSIGDWAFCACQSLTSVSISDSVTSIGDGAFSGCPGLTSITIPNSVTSIGNSAFMQCSSLTSISIPESVTSIDNYAFDGCLSLKSITIPNSVTSIGDCAFRQCSSLTSITIPDSVTSIGDWAFSTCDGLTSITIPSSVTSMGDYAFYNCSNLKDVYYGGTTEKWNSMYKGDYNSCLTNATIHYNSSKSVATTSAGINSNVEIKPKKTDIASVGAGVEQSYSHEHLVAGSEALFVVVEGSTDNFEITSDTLLYIGQTTVDENGCASVDVSQDFSSYNAVALIFGDCDHSASLWNMSVEPTFDEKALNVCMCDYCENVIDTEDLTFLGDVDISGHVDIVDATYIQKFIAMFADIAEPELMFADVNDDGVVSIMDATLIQMYLAELLTDSETV